MTPSGIILNNQLADFSNVNTSVSTSGLLDLEVIKRPVRDAYLFLPKFD